MKVPKIFFLIQKKLPKNSKKISSEAPPGLNTGVTWMQYATATTNCLILL